MKLHKKAIEAGFLVALIIVLTSFVLIAGTIFRFISTADDAQAEALCKDSLALRATTVINLGGAGVKTVPPLCKTIDKKISGDAESIKTQIADNMARCWEIMGEGLYPNSVWKNVNFGTKKNQCYICYSLIAEETKQFESPNSIPPAEFEQFIRTTSYDDPNDKRTYLDYFQFGGGNGRVVAFLKEEGIVPGGGYYVAFKSRKGDCGFCKTVLKYSGATTLGGIAVIALAPVTIPGIAAVTIAGATVTAASGSIALGDLFKGAEIDSILLVDAGHEGVREQLSKNCELMGDIAGK